MKAISDTGLVVVIEPGLHEVGELIVADGIGVRATAKCVYGRNDLRTGWYIRLVGFSELSKTKVELEMVGERTEKG